MKPEDREQVPLAEAVMHLLEECRMVLPGVQALFGFQLIAVFSNGFAEKLTATEQRIHLLALMLVAISIAMLMAPAAFHRQTHLHHVTESFLRLASRLLLGAMIALMPAIGLEFYLIARIITAHPLLSLIATIGLLILFSILWFLLPRNGVLQRWLGGGKQ